MKIYFAGSISGGRGDSELYAQIIEELRSYGQVLTEHLGDPTLTNMGEQRTDPGFILRRDVAWLTAADVVVAEVSTPSLGVGYELARAETMGKRVLCLYREQSGRHLSSMISGNGSFNIRTYGTLEDARAILREFFAA